MFLTTAIDDLWDKEENDILLAGKWCLKYKKEIQKKLTCLPYQWEHSDDIYDAQVL